MGRGQGPRKQRLMRRDFKGANRRDDTWDSKRGGKQGEFLGPEDLANPAFEEYYKAQGIVPEGEWDAFVEALRRPLPITFRINGSGQFANELREKLQSDFFANFNQGPIVLDGEVVDPPRPLPWYPNNLAWHMNFSRGQLRKLSWLSDIHEFMKAANEAGSITRQEAVSMVPPLFMDVRPHHRVLDMCAAPGSKTFQLLEMLHDFDGSGVGGAGGAAGARAAHDSSSGSTPSGFVVANDADAQRCNLLVHQTKRMCSPCLMVTNHEGQSFPRISASSGARRPGSAAAAEAAAQAAVDGGGDEQVGEQGPAANGVGKVVKDDVMLFDRILADVPCSGDGTMRKAPDIWRRWSVNNGNGLHHMQLRIALQAARLLKVGGRMVYSTCTFNPIEDEAVVAELLLRCGGALQLLDVSDHLPALRRLPGMRSWRVRDKFRWYDSWEEAQKVCFKLDPTMFSSPEKQQLPLERCMRILPHHQDTGGFFIAVLEKVAPTPPLEEPKMTHRFMTYLQMPGSRNQSRIVMCDGLDPQQGAADATEVALQAASDALDALDAGDLAAVEAAEATAAAAYARAGMAKDASSKAFKLAQQYEQQEARRQKKEQQQQEQQQQQQQAGDAGAGDAAAPQDEQEEAEAAAAAAAAMEGVEEAAVDGDEAMAAAGDADADADAEGTAELAAAIAAAAAAAGIDAAAEPFKPSWARGGGGRGRTAGGPGRFRGIDPIYPVEDPKILQMLVEFYGVEPGFPLSTHLITRSLESAMPKRLYYVSDSLLALLLADEREVLKITSTGLKLFERQDTKSKMQSPCCYRIAQEGLPFLLPHLTKQKVKMGVDDFMRLLVEKNLPLPTNKPQGQQAAGAGAGGDGGAGEQQAAKAPASGQKLLDTPAVLEELQAVQPGGAVAVLDEAAAQQLGLATSETSGALTVNAPLAIAVWRTPASLSVLVAKAECEQLAEKVRNAIARQQKLAQQQQQGGQQQQVSAAAL